MSSQTQVRGTRASRAEEAVNGAISRILDSITVETITQAFPEAAAADPQWMKALTDAAAQHLKVSLTENLQNIYHDEPRGEDLYDFRTFIQKSNELDNAEAEARQRVESSQVPTDYCLKQHNPDLYISAAVLPHMQDYMQHLHDSRAKLAQHRAVAAAKCIALNKELEAMQRDCQKLANGLDSAVDVMLKADLDGVETKQKDVIARLGANAL